MRFFCLKEQYNFYQKLYAGQPIIVIAIEEFLQEIINLKPEQEDSANAAEILKLIRALLIEGRNSIRDRVTIKDMLHYFIAYYSGGYLFDTNIRPSEDFCELPAYDNFMISGLTGSKRPGHIANMDIFAMYSPCGHPIAKEAFKQNIEGLKKIENEHRDKESAEYYKGLGQNVMHSIFTPWNNYVGGFWEGRRLNEKSYYFPSLKIIKEQENTHHHVMRKTYERRSELIRALCTHPLFSPSFKHAFEHYIEEPDLEEMHEELFGFPLPHEHYHDAFLQISLNNNDKFKSYLNNGLNIKMRVARSDGLLKNETLLHRAIASNNDEASELILNRKEGVELCDVAMWCESRRRSYTPLQLANECGNKKIATLIFNKTNEQNTSMSLKLCKPHADIARVDAAERDRCEFQNIHRKLLKEIFANNTIGFFINSSAVEQREDKPHQASYLKA